WKRAPFLRYTDATSGEEDPDHGEEAALRVPSLRERPSADRRGLRAAERRVAHRGTARPEAGRAGEDRDRARRASGRRRPRARPPGTRGGGKPRRDPPRRAARTPHPPP